MTEKTTKKPTKGTWDNLPTAEQAKANAEKERKPKVEFEVNKPVKVTFPKEFDKPSELGNDADGYYYIFDCTVDAVEKVIMTSAWTLLKLLKEASPLAGRTFEIVKKLEKGKQHFELKEVPLAVKV